MTDSTSSDSSTGTEGGSTSGVMSTSSTTGMETDSGATGSGSGGATTGPDLCGNGSVDDGEECDLGIQNADNGQCTSDCAINVCGDGLQHLGQEECDDGNTDDMDDCTSVCTNPACGDGLLSTGEECDNGGDNGAGMECNAECVLNVCGDSDVGPSEECDNGMNNGAGQACNGFCMNNVCGDGDVGPGETCDDGNVDPGDGCDAACKSETCGDSIQDATEDCDDGMNGDQDDGCTDDCTTPTCGDGYTQASLSEECDDGASNGDNAACTSSCKTAICGDNLVLTGTEECDDGNMVDDDGCANDCMLPVCGDGITQAGEGEMCDDGNTDPNDGCSPTCLLEECGNSIVDPGEDCDDGANGNQDDGCTDACKTPACQDGYTQASLNETCDDGNANNFDGCPNDCVLAACDDGVIEGTEVCEPGMLGGETCLTQNFDGGTLACSNVTCTYDTTGCFGCGDNNVDMGEQCDDGNQMTETCTYGETMCTVCDANCQNADGATSYCGDTAVDMVNGEECDDGNTMTESCAYGETMCTVCDAGCKEIDGATSFCGDGTADMANNEDCDTNYVPQACSVFDSNLYDSGTVACDTQACLFDTSDCGNCGDNIVDPQEGCDDGNTNTETCNYGETMCDVCNSTCQLVGGATSFCGDGSVDMANGEECEPGNFGGALCSDVAGKTWNMGGVKCNASCKFDYADCSECGDSQPEGKEECDDGNADDKDGCYSKCVLGKQPIMYYPFDASAVNQGTSGAAQDGVPNAVSWDNTNFKFGTHAAKMNGNSRIDVTGVNPLLSSSPDYTISIWYWEAAEQSGDLMDFRVNATPGGGFDIYDGAAVGTRITSCFSTNPAGFVTCASTDFNSVGEWHNVTYRCDGTGLVSPGGCDVELWHDGNLDTTAFLSGNVTFSPQISNNLVMGNFSDYTMDEVKIFDGVFSDLGNCLVVWGGTWDWINDACVLP